MKQKFTIEAEPRTEQGTGASRRLRHAGRVPAIVYGGKSEPKMISVNHNELWKHLKHEAFYSAILTLKIGEESEQVVLKDLHRHPVREAVLHMDLQRVLADVALRIRVPLHFKGADVAPGVKTGGGMVEHLLNDVEIEALPANLPEYFEIDVSGLNLNESIHLSQIALPAGVVATAVLHKKDQVVVSIHSPRAEEPDTPAAEAAAAAATAAPAAAGDAKKEEPAKKDAKK